MIARIQSEEVGAFVGCRFTLILVVTMSIKLHSLSTILAKLPKALAARIPKRYSKISHRHLPTPSLRRLANIGLAATLIASASIPVINFIQPSVAEAGWYSEDWHYRQRINLDHTALESNVYTTITLDTSDTSKFKASCADLRFTDQYGQIIPHYVSSGCGTSSTSIQLLLSSFPSGEQEIYVYYGNPQATSTGYTSAFSNAATGVTTTYDSEEKSEGPIAQWKFDEGYGASTNDSSTNNLDGTISGAAWRTESECVSGRCLYFDGVDDYITMGDVLEPSNITVAAWVRPNQVALNQRIVSKWGDTNAEHQYILTTDDAQANEFSFAIGTGASNHDICDSNSTSGTYSANQWYFVVGTYDGTTCKIYVNGKDVTEVFLDTASGAMKSATIPLRIGIEGDDGTSNPFNGSIDQVRFYDYVRTQSQIQKGYVYDQRSMAGQNGNLSEGLIGHWKMDEGGWGGVSGEVKDSSGSGKNSTAAGGATTGVGKFGNGGVFDGVDDKVVTGSTIPCSLNQSVTAWVKGNAISGNDTIFEIQACGGRFLVYYNGSSDFVFYPHNNGSMTSTGSYATGTWHHVTFTTEQINATEITAKIYVNGALNLSQNFTFETPSSSNETISIGSVSGVGGNYFSGSIDDLRVYSRNLTPQEAQQLYSFAPAPFAQYEFEENSGNTYYNSAGNGLYNLGHVGNASARTQGKFGRAVEITPGGYLSAGSKVPPLNISISAWVNTSVVDDQNIAGFGSLGRYILGLSSDNKLYFRVYDDSTYHDRKSSVVYDSDDLNMWHHAAATYDGVMVKFYWDGAYVSESALSAVPAQSSTSLCVGYCANGYFEGGIDRILYYDYPRTPSQIVEDMNGGKLSVSTPLAHYKFDEGNGATANNSGYGGSALNGTLNGNAWIDGVKGKALNFDNSDYVSLAQGSSLPIYDSVTTGYSISMWVKGMPQTSSYIYGEAATAGGDQKLLFAPHDTTGKLMVYLRDDAGGFQILNETSNSANVFDGTWHHILWTDLNGKAKLYIDGKLDSHNFDYSAGTTHTFDTSVIGGVTASLNRFDGQMDEVKLYQYSLSAQDVMVDYNLSSGAVMGATSTVPTTTPSGTPTTTPSNSAGSEYCVPGDTTSCAGPVGEWRFEEGGGTTVKDTSGNGHNGTWRNSLASYGIGKVGHGGVFDATNYAVSMGAKAELNNISAFTISAWVKMNATAGSANYRIAGTLYSGGSQGYVIMRDGPANKLVFVWGTGSGTSGLSSTNTITADKWYYIVGTFDGSTMKLYVDGQLQSTSSSPTFSTTSSQNFCIGGVDGVCSIARWNGGIDQVRYFNYARSAAQVAWDYNKGKPVAHFKLNECHGSTINDSINKLGGTITIGGTGTQSALGTCNSSGAWFNGKVGKREASLSFDGTDDYVSVPDHASLDYGDNDFSISAWVNSSDTSTQMGIVGKGTNNHTQPGWNLVKRHGSPYNGLEFRLSTAAVGNMGITPSQNITSQIWDGQWHHVAVSLDRDGQGVIYLDGKSIASTTISAESSSVNNSQSVTFGTLNQDGNGNVNYYSGKIDDVQIFNYALTDAQVKTLHNGGAVRWE